MRKKYTKPSINTSSTEQLTDYFGFSVSSYDTNGRISGELWRGSQLKQSAEYRFAEQKMQLIKKEDLC
jgi:hypothetical protein